MCSQAQWGLVTGASSLDFFFASCPSSSPFLVLAEFERAVISIYHRLPLQSLRLVALQQSISYPDFVLHVADLCNLSVPFPSELEVSMSYAFTPKSISVTEHKRNNICVMRMQWHCLSFHSDIRNIIVGDSLHLMVCIFHWGASWLGFWVSIFYSSKYCDLPW